MSLCDQIPSGVHPPKSGTAGVESALFPFLILGSLTAPVPPTLQPSGATHPGGLLPDPGIQLQVKQAAIAMSVGGKVTPVSFSFQRLCQWLFSNKKCLSCLPCPRLADRPD